MKIKSVREPNEKEKSELIPKLALYSSVSAILTVIFYVMGFTGPLEESMYITDNFLAMKTAAEHNLIIKVFEFFYHRDYMLSKLEGIPISALLGIVTTAVFALGIEVYEKVKGTIK